MRRVPLVEPRILVGLRHPANMPRLLEVGQLLAEELGEPCQPFCVVGDAETGGDAFAQRLCAIAGKACDEQHASAPLRVEARSFRDGLVGVVTGMRPSHLLIGYLPHREEDLAGERAFAQTLRQLLRKCAGHLVVAHFGEPREIRRVLVPLACDENLEPVAQLTRALLRQPGTEVTLAHVLPEDASTTNHHAAAAFLRQAAERGALVASAQFEIASHDDVAEGLLELAWGHDAVIMGLPGARSLSDRIFGTVADQVATWSRCTTFLVHAAPPR